MYWQTKENHCRAVLVLSRVKFELVDDLAEERDRKETVVRVFVDEPNIHMHARTRRANRDKGAEKTSAY